MALQADGWLLFKIQGKLHIACPAVHTNMSEFSKDNSTYGLTFIENKTALSMTHPIICRVGSVFWEFSSHSELCTSLHVEHAFD